MDYLANFTLLPLRFAGNQLIENVGSPDGVANRAPLLYRLDIYKPAAYQSGTFVVHESLRGREAPVFEVGGIVFSEGCNFDLSEFVWGLLTASPPKAEQDTITVQPLATMPYYQKSWVEPYKATTEVTSSIQYLLRAKLNEDQFAVWKENFFSSYLQEKRGFLTWQPNTAKIIDRDQPEFLSFLVHHNPVPTALKVRVDVEFQDGSRYATTLTPIQLTTVSNYSLYTVPVGFSALGLDEIEEEEEKDIFAYTVWLSDQNTQSLTEERRYIVNNDYQPYVRHVVFLNSLGGWDTLRLFGVSKEQLQVNTTLFQRQLEAKYTPSSEELFVTNIAGKRKLTLNTGYLPDRQWLLYLEEILWTEKVFVHAQEGLIPLVLSQNTYDLPDDEEDFAGRTFVFEHSKTAIGYSALPSPPIFTNVARPMVWVGYGGYCLINDRGLRTGYQAFTMLELRYSDGLHERVPGTLRKPNNPDELGYLPPTLSAECAATPYLNTEISRVGSFLRNNCGPNYKGSAATIVIAAGQYGSESSQTEADTRAESAWSLLNTQDRANQYGSCTLSIFYSVAVSQLSTYTKNTCSGTQYGSPWTITVPADAYTSNTSQADANNQAIAYANSLDTQANANLYALCRNLWDYDYNVPSGYFHYRTNRPTEISIYLIMNSMKRRGNYTAMVSMNPDTVEVFASGTNDLNFQVANIGGSGLAIYNPASSARSADIYIYRNGVLYDVFADIGPINAGTNYGTSFVNVAQITDGAKFYIRLVWK